MKKIFAIALTLVVAVASSATAASISVKPVGTAANNVYSIYVDGEASNGAFDTIYFKVTPSTGTFINTNSGAAAGVPRPAGDAFTYPNRMLNADPLDFPGALGLTQVGLVNTAQELSFTVGALGGTVSTAAQPGGDLFLGNVMLSGGHFWANIYVRIQLISAGNVIFDDATGTPEPASFSIAALGFAALVTVRRRCHAS